MSESAAWDAYFELVRTIKWADVESKMECERAAERYLRSVTNEVLASKVNWINAAEGDIRRYLNRLGGGWMRMTYLAKWYDEEPERVAAALRDLWALCDESPDGLPSRDEVFTRIRRFTRELPFVRNLMGAGGRMGLIAALLIRISIEHYPPFGVRMFATAYDFTHHPKPHDNADEATLYEHALEFLDQLIEEAGARGLERPRNLLEAQSVVFMLRRRA